MTLYAGVMRELEFTERHGDYMIAGVFIMGLFHSSHRSGYVGVPKGHPCYGHDYDSKLLTDVDVHGGLTYSSDCDSRNYPLEHTNEYWWFGFDCAHLCDSINPKSKEFVRKECVRLLEQLKAKEARK